MSEQQVLLDDGIAKRSYNVERHYDGIAGLYKKVESYNPRKHVLIRRQFVEIFKDLSGLSVLDLGCGQGFFSLLAKKLGAKCVIGVDASRKQIELARKNGSLSGLEYLKSDIANIQLNKKFNVVTAGFVFSYAESKSVLGKMMAVAYRHLKRNGRLFAVVCNPDNPTRYERKLYRVVPVDGEKPKDGAMLRCEFYDKNDRMLCHDYKFLWSKNTVETICNEIGFRDVKWVDIENLAVCSRKIPALPSTNIIFLAKRY